MKTKTQSILPTLSSKNTIRLGQENQVRFQKFMSHGSNVWHGFDCQFNVPNESMHAETVQTINSQDITLIFHTSVYGLVSALKTILCNTSICLIFNLFSTYHTKHILDRKDFYWDVTRLRAWGKRDEMEWKNKFQANLMSKNPFEILNLRCFKWFTSLATLIIYWTWRTFFFFFWNYHKSTHLRLLR